MTKVDEKCQKQLDGIAQRLGQPDNPWQSWHDVKAAEPQLERLVQVELNAIHDEFRAYFDQRPEHNERLQVEEEQLLRKFEQRKDHLRRELQVRWNRAIGDEIIENFHHRWQQRLQVSYQAHHATLDPLQSILDVMRRTSCIIGPRGIGKTYWLTQFDALCKESVIDGSSDQRDKDQGEHTQDAPAAGTRQIDKYPLLPKAHQKPSLELLDPVGVGDALAHHDQLHRRVRADQLEDGFTMGDQDRVIDKVADIEMSDRLDKSLDELEPAQTREPSPQSRLFHDASPELLHVLPPSTDALGAESDAEGRGEQRSRAVPSSLPSSRQAVPQTKGASHTDLAAATVPAHAPGSCSKNAEMGKSFGGFVLIDSQGFLDDTNHHTHLLDAMSVIRCYTSSTALYSSLNTVLRPLSHSPVSDSPEKLGLYTFVTHVRRSNPFLSVYRGRNDIGPPIPTPPVFFPPLPPSALRILPTQFSHWGTRDFEPGDTTAANKSAKLARRKAIRLLKDSKRDGERATTTAFIADITESCSPPSLS
mmetsp:Transcript_38448/g.89939  ORF Transcript_38448/g.89939 Transcript_38448/m.89939 type:complete len:532 (+) Transcript_38448:2-1597(+)